VAAQLAVDPAALETYGEREATRTAHTQVILAYLRCRRWQPLIDIGPLEKWLLERALEHDNERVLLGMACEWLRGEGILRPAIIELERLVTSLAELANQETYRRLDALLAPSIREALDRLLVVDVELRLTPHNWLAKPPVSPTASQIRLTLRKRQYLAALGVEDWQTDALHPNRRKRLAALARSKTNQALARLGHARRYPMLVAFCQETHITLTDYVLRLFDEYWEDIVGRANRELVDSQLRQVKAKDGALIALGKAAQPIVDEVNIPASELRQRVYDQIPREELLAAIEVVLALTGKGPRTFHSFLSTRYRSIKSFSAGMLDQLVFEHAFEGDDFQQAMELVSDWQSGRRRKLPDKVPMTFLLPSWKAFVEPFEGEFDRQAYELNVLARLRDLLRSGDVYVRHSRRYAGPDTYLMPPAHWKSHRPDLLAHLGYRDATAYRLDEHLSDLESHLPLLEKLLAEGGDIRLDQQGELVITPLKAGGLPKSVVALRAVIDRLLPRVELTDVLRGRPCGRGGCLDRLFE